MWLRALRAAASCRDSVDFDNDNDTVVFISASDVKADVKAEPSRLALASPSCSPSSIKSEVLPAIASAPRAYTVERVNHFTRPDLRRRAHVWYRLRIRGTGGAERAWYVDVRYYEMRRLWSAIKSTFTRAAALFPKPKSWFASATRKLGLRRVGADGPARSRQLERFWTALMAAVIAHRPASAEVIGWIYEFLGISDYERMHLIEQEEAAGGLASSENVHGDNVHEDTSKPWSNPPRAPQLRGSREEPLLNRVLPAGSDPADLFTSPESAYEYVLLMDPEALRLCEIALATRGPLFLNQFLPEVRPQTLAAAMRNVFGSRPNPIIPRTQYHFIIKQSRFKRSEDERRSLDAVLLRLDPAVYQTLRILCLLCARMGDGEGDARFLSGAFVDGVLAPPRLERETAIDVLQNFILHFGEAADRERLRRFEATRARNTAAIDREVARAALTEAMRSHSRHGLETAIARAEKLNLQDVEEPALLCARTMLANIVACEADLRAACTSRSLSRLDTALDAARRLEQTNNPVYENAFAVRNDVARERKCIDMLENACVRAESKSLREAITNVRKQHIDPLPDGPVSSAVARAKTMLALVTSRKALSARIRQAMQSRSYGDLESAVVEVERQIKSGNAGIKALGPPDGYQTAQLTLDRFRKWCLAADEPKDSCKARQLLERANELGISETDSRVQALRVTATTLASASCVSERTSADSDNSHGQPPVVKSLNTNTPHTVHDEDPVTHPVTAAITPPVISSVPDDIKDPATAHAPAALVTVSTPTRPRAPSEAPPTPGGPLASAIRSRNARRLRAALDATSTQGADAAESTVAAAARRLLQNLKQEDRVRAALRSALGSPRPAALESALTVSRGFTPLGAASPRADTTLEPLPMRSQALPEEWQARQVLSALTSREAAGASLKLAIEKKETKALSAAVQNAIGVQARLDGALLQQGACDPGRIAFSAEIRRAETLLRTLQELARERSRALAARDADAMDRVAEKTRQVTGRTGPDAHDSERVRVQTALGTALSQRCPGALAAAIDRARACSGSESWETLARANAFMREVSELRRRQTAALASRSLKLTRGACRRAEDLGVQGAREELLCQYRTHLRSQRRITTHLRAAIRSGKRSKVESALHSALNFKQLCARDSGDLQASGTDGADPVLEAVAREFLAYLAERDALVSELRAGVASQDETALSATIKRATEFRPIELCGVALVKRGIFSDPSLDDAKRTLSILKRPQAPPTRSTSAQSGCEALVQVDRKASKQGRARTRGLLRLWKSKLALDEKSPTRGRRASTEMAELWIEQQIEALTAAIRRHGRVHGQFHEITFGELLRSYDDISQTVVGILRRAKKLKIIEYEADVLFRGRSEAVLIRMRSSSTRA